MQGSFLTMFRIGNDYDVHRLVAGRKPILSDVEIPHPLIFFVFYSLMTREKVKIFLAAIDKDRVINIISGVRQRDAVSYNKDLVR